jgi:hypothetical protein
MPRKMYSLAQPMLADTSAMEIAGTAIVDRIKAGARFLLFIAS